MMRRLSRCILATLVVLLTTTGENSLAQQRTDLSSLDLYIQTTMKDWKTPGVAVGIVQGTSPIYLKGFGVRNIETGQTVTADTLFDIGSCTKAFTSASIAMLADEGKMSWDEKMDEAIPYFHLQDPMADEYVTVRDLLTHRTGVPGADLIWYGSPIAREDIVRRAAFIQPDAGFRALFQYNNVMYVALGVAVGRASGGTWDEFVKQHIFQPLGMSESDTSSIDAQKSPDYASPHVLHDGHPQVIPWRNIDNAGPAGSINSSVRDMAKWIALQLNDGIYDGKRLISSKNMEEMHRPQMVTPPGELPIVFFPDSMQLSYGLGWFVQDYRGHQLILHPGDIDGFEALTVLIPEIHTGYEVLVNIGGNSYRQAVGYHIADMLLHLPEQDWSAHFKQNDAKFQAEAASTTAAWESKRVPNAHPSHDLSAFAGNFQNDVYGKASVSLDDGHLKLRFHGTTSTLEHFQYDTFLAHLDPRDPDPMRLNFTQNLDGTISGLDFAGSHFGRQKPTTAAAQAAVSATH